MSIENRRFIRFSLDVPALRRGERWAPVLTTIKQISVGGCLLDWEEGAKIGDEFRLELELPNGNHLPVRCLAVYQFEGSRIGAKFLDLSAFEQELIGQIISESLEKEGLPLTLNPFAVPPSYKPPPEPRQRKFL